MGVLNQIIVSKAINYEEQIVSNIVRTYCSQFIGHLNEVKADLLSVDIDVNKALPYPFNSRNELAYSAYYSLDRKHVFILFKEKDKKTEELEFFFKSLFGNPCQYISPSIDFSGDIPFKEIPFEKISLKGFTHNNKKINIEFYGLLIPCKTLTNKLKSIRQYVREFVHVYWGKFCNKQRNPQIEYLNYLDEIKQRMAEIFFDESTGELVIDKFLENHPEVLERGLNLIRPMHQVVLKNILGKYEHDLKPDLIAYDESDKIWTIIDYKKAKRTIIKNQNKVRTGFKAEVHALQDQLRDYIEYFDEREHREDVLKRYQIKVEHPKAMGIIGNVSSEEKNDFNRLIKYNQRWFEVVPYNYLYDNFCKYVELANLLLRK